MMSEIRHAEMTCRLAALHAKDKTRIRQRHSLAIVSHLEIVIVYMIQGVSYHVKGGLTLTV